jgi:hypothetical protein
MKVLKWKALAVRMVLVRIPRAWTTSKEGIATGDRRGLPSHFFSIASATRKEASSCSAEAADHFKKYIPRIRATA